MKRLYFIRHGESEGNVLRIFCGHWDTPLTPLGKQQAQDAGRAAKELNINVIISSPLIRALQTASIIAENIAYAEDKIILTDLLMERNYGSLQEQSYDSIGDNFDFEKAEGIEPEAEVIKRAGRALDFIKSIEQNNVLIVSHGSIGRALHQEITHSHSEGVEISEEFEIPNCKIIQWI